MAFRCDTFRVDASAIERTPGGAIRVPAQLTRSGVFTYVDQGGKSYREWRPPEEVERADSLATLEDVTVTIGHPKLGVSPHSFGDISVGHVRSGSVKAQKTDKGVDAVGSLVIARNDAIDGLTTRRLYDTSSGYDVRLDETPGTTPAGESYDRVQRDIVYNHVALLPRGDGRLGTSLRLDSAGEQIEDRDEGPKTMTKIKIKRADGKEVEVDRGGEEHVAYLEARADAAEARATNAEKRLAEYDARAATEARTALEAKARGLLGAEWKPVRADGAAEVTLTDREIKEAVIKRADSSFDGTGKPDAYVDARFDIATTERPAPAPRTPDPKSPAGKITTGLNDPTGASDPSRADSGPTVEKDPRAYAKSREDAAKNLHKRPN